MLELLEIEDKGVVRGPVGRRGKGGKTGPRKPARAKAKSAKLKRKVGRTRR
jgi:hypothetical protein